MKKIIGFIFIVLVGFWNTCLAKIIQTNDIKIIENILKLADRDTLVIFDVDDVLLVPNDKILQTPNKKYLEKLNSKLEQTVGQKDAKIFYSIIFDQRQNGPLDARMKNVILELQSREIKVLALTNCFTGQFGNIKSMEAWRYRELSKNGYNFEKSWKELEDKVFDKLKEIDNGYSAKTNLLPMFMKGIVFTSSLSKGKAFEAFLKHAQFIPKKVIFIDDKKKHLESVQEAALRNRIQFMGIEYTAIDHVQTEPLNESLADLQYKVLEQEGKWISDVEAEKLLVQ